MSLGFTIIITCHNYERYVSDSILSAKSQTYQNVQIIAVNAGSTDNSRQVIESFEGVTLIDAPKGSHAIACNVGFAKAAGDVIIFLDADDCLNPDACERIATIWSRTTSKTQYNLQIIDKVGKRLNRTVSTFPKRYCASSIRNSFVGSGTYIWPPTSGNAYARTYLNSVFPLLANLPPDGQLNTAAPLFGDVQVINENLGCYRLHDSNLDYQNHESSSLERFSKSIKRRYREMRYAKRLARKFNLYFPKRNILNFEFAFISYRLFLKQCIHTYQGSRRESKINLIYLMFSFLIGNHLPLSFSAKVIIWHLLLLALPPELAKSMVKKRFNRGI
jgi:glycosyltransferase involved in cell wall biosynthesis